MGEELKLNVTQTIKLQEILGGVIKNTDFIWKSSNEDVAEVNESGTVIGIKDGYTTIYAKHKVHNIYTMCVVNVAETKANPMVETGDGFTAVLKADGTVWIVRRAYSSKNR